MSQVRREGAPAGGAAVGCAALDLSALHLLGCIDGYYNIQDLQQRVQGQIKVQIVPVTAVQPSPHAASHQEESHYSAGGPTNSAYSQPSPASGASASDPFGCGGEWLTLSMPEASAVARPAATDYWATVAMAAAAPASPVAASPSPQGGSEQPSAMMDLLRKHLQVGGFSPGILIASFIAKLWLKTNRIFDVGCRALK